MAVDRTSEAEVAAEAYGKVVETSQFAGDGQKVGECLGRVGMAAVAGVDDRHTAHFCGGKLRSLYVVAHRYDVGEILHHSYCVAHRLTLAYRTAGSIGEAEHIAAEFHHCCRETESRAGRRFVEKCGEFLTLAFLRVFGAVVDDVESKIDDLFGLFHREVDWIYEMFHLCLKG